MAGGPDALLEELRAATDGILALPDGLLELAMGDGPFDLARRMDRLDMRLPALRLLVDAREVGKALTAAPAGNGAVASKIVEAAESAPDSVGLYNMKAIFDLTAQGLDDLPRRSAWCPSRTPPWSCGPWTRLGAPGRCIDTCKTCPPRR